MPISDLNAPFKKNPVFLRDSFLKAPDWRWRQAVQIANTLSFDFLFVDSLEPVILFAAKIIKAMLTPATRQFIRLKQPDTWLVITLGQMDNTSQLKAALLACIIYGYDLNKTSLKLKWIKPIQVKLYCDLFLDLTGIQGISEWFEQMLLLPARQSKSMNLFRARALAHYHSLNSALNSLRFGNSGTSAKLVMASMWRDARDKQLFDYMAKNLNVPILIYVTSMLQAVKNRLLHLFLMLNKLGNSLGAALMDAAKSLDNSVRSFTQSLISDPQSVDPSSEYIKIITNKNQLEN